MTRPRSPFAFTLLIVVVGAAILAGLAGAWTLTGALVESADPWLRPFVPVLDTVSAALSGQECAATRVAPEVTTLRPVLAC